MLQFLFFASVLSQHVVFDHEINGENGVSLGTLRIEEAAKRRAS